MKGNGSTTFTKRRMKSQYGNQVSLQLNGIVVDQGLSVYMRFSQTMSLTPKKSDFEHEIKCSWLC